MDRCRHSILVIDDDQGILDLFVEALHMEGYTVVAVDSAEAGLEQLPYNDFSVAFVDHHLPGMDGLTLCGYLRRANPLVEVVLMTGAPDARLEQAAREEGIRFLTKPLDFDEILDLVEDHVERLSEREDRLAEPPPFFSPVFSPYLARAVANAGLPAAPERLQRALIRELKAALSRLRTRRTHDERDRTFALAGILAARLLGIDLPKVADGRTMEEEYDRLMAIKGLRTEFASTVEREGD